MMYWVIWIAWASPSSYDRCYEWHPADTTADGW